MDTYIAEIAGKDSVAAVIKFAREIGEAEIIPTIVYTGTEYGDKNSYFDSIEFIKRKTAGKNIVFSDTAELENGALWNLICVKYQYLLNKKYGFNTPCIGCHLFAHLMRLPLLRETGAKGIITGERYSHQGKLKANQHPMTIKCFTEIFGKNGAVMVRPLLGTDDTYAVNAEIEDEKVIAHANDVKCVLSGNLQGFELEKNLDKLEHYLNDFLKPVGDFLAESMLEGRKNMEAELEEFIRGILI